MEESDTYLMILEQGMEKQARMNVLIVGEECLGPPDESVKSQLETIADLERFRRMPLRALTAATWQEILETP